MKLISVALVLILGQFLVAGAAAQSTSEKLDKLMDVCEQLRNPAATDRLRILRREMPLYGRTIIVLGKQARANVSAQPLVTDAVEFLVQVFRDLGLDLLKDPAGAIRALDEKGVKAELLSPETVDLMAALDRSFHLKIAEGAISRFAERGAFDGMFATLFEERPRVARAFMDIFLDRLRSASFRAYASQGVAEVARADQYTAFANEAAQILKQSDEETYIKHCALVLMKRCGAATEFDAETARLETELATELAKSKGEQDLSKLLLNYEILVDLYGRAGVLRNALAYDEAYCRLLLGNCNYETQAPEARAGIKGALYDFACRLSRSGSIEASGLVLELAISWGYQNMEWLESDPELQTWRQGKGNQEKLVNYKAGKLAPGSRTFSPELWDKVVAGAVKNFLKSPLEKKD